jgi:hypothetical protein
MYKLSDRLMPYLFEWFLFSSDYRWAARKGQGADLKADKIKPCHREDFC